MLKERKATDNVCISSLVHIFVEVVVGSIAIACGGATGDGGANADDDDDDDRSFCIDTGTVLAWRLEIHGKAGTKASDDDKRHVEAMIPRRRMHRLIMVDFDIFCEECGKWQVRKSILTHFSQISRDLVRNVIGHDHESREKTSVPGSFILARVRTIRHRIMTHMTAHSTAHNGDKMRRAGDSSLPVSNTHYGTTTPSSLSSLEHSLTGTTYTS
jgi:hypothetical protein